jgi:hypothetical protein
MPGVFDLTYDFCELMSPKSTTIAFFRTVSNNFFSGSMEKLEKNFHECPWNNVGF